MTDAATATPGRKPLGTAGALGAIAVITVVTLLVMGVVLTQDPAPDSGRRTSSGGSDSDASAAATTSTTTTAPPKPGPVQPLPELDEITGWSTDLSVTNGVGCAGPVVQANTVAVFCDDRHLFGFDVTSGEQLWDTKVDDDAPTFIAPPVASGTNQLVYPRASEVISVDAGTGAVSWRAPRDSIVLGLGATEGHVLVVGGGQLVALDPATGTIQWATPFATDVFTNGGVQVTASPTDAVVVLGRGIQTFDLATGDARWTATVGTEDGPAGELVSARTSPEAVYVIAGSGTVTALDARTGAPQWEQKAMFGRQWQMIAGLDADTIYLSSSAEIGALSRADGSKRWSFTSEEALNQPESIDRSVFENGHLIARALGQVWDIDPKTGVVKAGKTLSTASPGRVRDEKLFTLQSTFSPRSAWRLHALGL